MKNLEYKGYTGSIEYSKEDGQLFGIVLEIRGLSLMSETPEENSSLNSFVSESVRERIMK